MMSEVSEKRRDNVVAFLMNSYQLTEEEVKEYAERGNYYVLNGNLASAGYFAKKQTFLPAH